MAKVRIMDEAWDHLIVLDACRYDYFEAVWKDHLRGELSKRESVGSTTVEWRDESFPGRHDDVVYVSSNPYVNSIMPVKDFSGSEHFAAVYDVWKTGWDEKRGTVLPETVTDAAVRALMQHEDKRMIVHYLQPHAPYLSLDIEAGGFPLPDLGTEKVLTGVTAGSGSGAKQAIFKMLFPICYKTGVLGSNPTWKLRQLLRMEPASPMDAVRRQYGDHGLRDAYRANLEIVLRSVGTLLKYMAGRIVITSDHGELLGEGGSYSHWGGSRNPLLVEIPWLVITKGEREKRPEQAATGQAKPAEKEEEGQGKADDERIKARLKALGYID
jgi:hypothetical protein